MDSILHIFPAEMRVKWGQILEQLPTLEEIRIRVNLPVQLLLEGREYFAREDGRLCTQIPERGSGYCLDETQIQRIVEQCCGFSAYAYLQELEQGFLTIPGGHRIGICGEMLWGEQIKQRGFRTICFLNIRIAHEIQGCAQMLLPQLIERNKLCNTLLISPPGEGKTTMLRDLTRLISEGTKNLEGRKVVVIDERGELSGSYHGVPKMNLGTRTDVLFMCPKTYGMQLAVRSMSPQVVVVDELGTRRDVQCVQQLLASGCCLLASLHASCMEDLQRKEIGRLLLEEQCFERYVFLEKRNGRFEVREIRKNGNRVGKRSLTGE